MQLKNHYRVAHLVRKLLPPFSSFIRNQIMNHQRYDACVVYKEHIKSDFADEIIGSLPAFYCESGKNGISKYYSKLLYNRPLRRLTRNDKKNIREFLQNQRVNILHFHYGTDAAVFIEITEHLDIPLVVSFYGYDCSSFPRWYFGLGTHYLRRVFKNIDYCLAMSEDMKTDLIDIGCPREKIIVHYYGTDVQQFPSKEIYNEKDEIVFLSVGYLVPQKGHAFTLSAFKKALQLTSKKMKLRIVGRGRLESRLKRYVVTNGLSGHVHFVGPLRHLSHEFFDEYRGADVFIHPSVVSETNEKEGIPGAIVEAMAAGLPVISTNHAGIPYVIRDGETGLLVNEWDIDALSNRICRLAENIMFRRTIGQQARKYALQHLDLKQKEIELENIYDRVIAEYKKH